MRTLFDVMERTLDAISGISVRSADRMDGADIEALASSAAELREAIAMEESLEGVITDFAHWLNAQRDQKVSEVFHEILSRSKRPHSLPDAI